jgi:hypothetical protein
MKRRPGRMPSHEMPSYRLKLESALQASAAAESLGNGCLGATVRTTIPAQPGTPQQTRDDGDDKQSCPEIRPHRKASLYNLIGRQGIGAGPSATGQLSKQLRWAHAPSPMLRPLDHWG